jgi:hypothetical protein
MLSQVKHEKTLEASTTEVNGYISGSYMDCKTVLLVEVLT